MNGQTPNPPPAWSGGSIPAGVRQPPAKRPRPPARRPPDPSFRTKFVPPKDLATHLAKFSPTPKNPLNRPKSNMKYGIRAEYGQLFPYYNPDLVRALKPLTDIAGFIEIKPFKGYIDLGFQSIEQANYAATIQVTYKDTNIPITITSHHSQPTLILQLVNLPTHLPATTLRSELIKGLDKYGSNPQLQFDVPNETPHLAGPSAIATITLHATIDPSNIPPWAVVNSAPNDPFNIKFEAAQQSCIKCKTAGHLTRNCKLAKSASLHLNPTHPSTFPWWGSLIPTPAPEPPLPPNGTPVDSPPQNSSESRPKSNMPLETMPSNLTNQNVNITQSPSAQELRSCAQFHLGSNPSNQTNWAENTTAAQSLNNSNEINDTNPSNQSIHQPNGTQIATCSPPTLTLVNRNPFDILQYYQVEDSGLETPIISIPHQDWFSDDDSIEKYKFRQKNQFTGYINSHTISSKIKNSTMPEAQIDALKHANINIQCNIPHIKIPQEAPEEMYDALEEASFFARLCLKDLSLITTQSIVSRGKLPINQNTIKLIEARKNAEGALSTLATTLYSCDLLIKGTTILSHLEPHLADCPTPWLSALERFNTPPTLEPDPPPDCTTQMD